MKRAMVAPILVIGLSALLFVPSAGASQGVEQIVFSGTGGGTFNGTDTPMGFWIWCQPQSHNPYAFCYGSMYFHDLGIVEGIHSGTVTEIADDTYQMVVSSKDGSVQCTLTNEPPIVGGPHNTVDVSCSSPSGSGQSTSAVVKATGPGG